MEEMYNARSSLQRPVQSDSLPSVLLGCVQSKDPSKDLQHYLRKLYSQIPDSTARIQSNPFPKSNPLVPFSLPFPLLSAPACHQPSDVAVHRADCRILQTFPLVPCSPSWCSTSGSAVYCHKAEFAIRQHHAVLKLHRLLWTRTHFIRRDSYYSS